MRPYEKDHSLIIEDEEAIRDLLRFSFPAAEFTLLDAETVGQGIHVLADKIPDLIILIGCFQIKVE